MIIIQLNERQLKIIAIVKENEPITGEKIAEKLRVTRATLRSDLVVLTMTGILDARPKVGYFYVGEGNFSNENSSMKNTKVSSVMGVPLTARQSDSVYDVIVNIFLIRKMYITRQKYCQLKIVEIWKLFLLTRDIIFFMIGHCWGFRCQ